MQLHHQNKSKYLQLIPQSYFFAWGLFFGVISLFYQNAGKGGIAVILFLIMPFIYRNKAVYVVFGVLYALFSGFWTIGLLYERPFVDYLVLIVLVITFILSVGLVIIGARNNGHQDAT